jgi:hypothetical protein
MSEKILGERLGTLWGCTAGGRMRPLLSRPGKASSREERKPAKPREKIFEELPGPEKVSRGI